MSKRKKQSGFTIVELMIATTVFSVILLIMSAGLIYIGKVYYRTVAQNKTQEATRSIIDQVAQSIQFSGGSIAVNGNAICVGDIKYFKSENALVDGGSNGLQRGGNGVACDNSGDPSSVQLVPDGMFLHEFTVVSDPSADIYTITVQVVSVPNDESISGSGESELFNSSTHSCRGGAGSEYCATSRLVTTIKKRL